MDIREQFNELIRIKEMIESDEFQKYLVAPLREKQGKLKVNFFSDSVKESWRKGGKHEGIAEFFGLLKQIDTDYKNAKFELDNPPL